MFLGQNGYHWSSTLTATTGEDLKATIYLAFADKKTFPFNGPGNRIDAFPLRCLNV